jgi:hypothetical protein
MYVPKLSYLPTYFINIPTYVPPYLHNLNNVVWDMEILNFIFLVLEVVKSDEDATEQGKIMLIHLFTF